MQHFGAPTRLVGFTRSPYVAAYFAFEDLPADGCDECAIVAMSPAWCYTRLGALAYEKDGLFDCDLAVIRASVAARKCRPPDEHVSDEFAAGNILSQRVEHWARTSTEAMVAVFEPRRLTERMSVQQGLFLWPGNVDQTVIENLLALGDSTGGVLELVVPLRERERALEQLRLMNITGTSLFPGLDGFAHLIHHVNSPAEDQNDAIADTTAHGKLIDALTALLPAVQRIAASARQRSEDATTALAASERAMAACEALKPNRGK
jgi:hypothetical protein